MVPLVTCVDELRAVKAIIEELKQELDAEGIAYDKDIQVGVMMETAAASLIADILAKEADFFSIGTNDLTGYTMAADRVTQMLHICTLHTIQLYFVLSEYHLSCKQRRYHGRYVWRSSKRSIISTSIIRIRIKRILSKCYSNPCYKEK